ncbi:HNH endonuclease signature motif containing protein [Pseudomonas asiatica]|uniref:HNH endonuclease n=1 Tax=Pseudomonas asiatica TaxID=2219225 RepID=UPI00345D0A38
MSKSSPRQFRGSESLAAEQRSRAAVRPFLEACGFEVIEDRLITTGAASQQIVSFHIPDGDDVKARVRLCWRRDGRNQNEQQYSAAQLTAHLRLGGWDATLEHVVNRDLAQGITHNLLFQREGEAVVYAALVPIRALHQIWNRQREVSDELLRRGLKGRIRKNHAQNGTSPTLWLQDDRLPDTHEVADVLWQWPGVVDLAKLVGTVPKSLALNDTYDDCPMPDYSALGQDFAQRVSTIRSHVKRDPKVRLAVLDRARYRCERCTESRSFPGFLDVHHILGAEVSDRFYNCVALCPNCHREAHYGESREELNKRLLEYASQFRA